MIASIDHFFFHQINSLAGRSQILDFLSVFFAKYSQYLIGAFLLVLVFLPSKNRFKNRQMVILALLSAFFVRLVVKKAILFFYERPRPFVFLPDTHQLFKVSAAENFRSFPSGHALFFFTLSTVVYCFNKKLGGLFFLFSFLMNIARILGGVHWPSDILAGAIFGALAGWLIFELFKRCQRKSESIC